MHADAQDRFEGNFAFQESDGEKFELAAVARYQTLTFDAPVDTPEGDLQDELGDVGAEQGDIEADRVIENEVEPAAKADLALNA